MNDLLIISCIFGKKFKYVHPSPDKEKAFFFTNNNELRNEIINKGWNYVYVNKPLTDDYVLSSLQSKYIKFLKFLDDFPQFQSVKTIIYFDHKELVSSRTIDEIKSLINDNLDKSLIIRQTPWTKTNVYEEVNDAMGQERYVKSMNITKTFIKDIMLTGEYNENVRICNTGLLIFIDRENITKLLNSVYERCIAHTQPECQIYWSIFSQKYKNKIKEIKWGDIKSIKRKEPQQQIVSLNKEIDLSNKALEKTVDIENINNIIKKHTHRFEGNCLYRHYSNFVQFEDGHRYNNKLILRKNFYNIVKGAKSLLEIGLNGGHSLGVFLLSNPKLEVLSFDICEHAYVRDVANYYKSKYNFTFVEGNSLITVKEYNNEKKYDVIHIDGGHIEECVVNDLINCKRFAHKDTLMIFDDTNAEHISYILNEYCKKGFITEIDYSNNLKECFFHRIFKYNM